MDNPTYRTQPFVKLISQLIEQSVKTNAKELRLCSGAIPISFVSELPQSALERTVSSTEIRGIHEIFRHAAAAQATTKSANEYSVSLGPGLSFRCIFNEDRNVNRLRVFFEGDATTVPWDGRNPMPYLSTFAALYQG